MPIGELLDNRYKLLRVVGNGGMAQVYLARDIILERDVAVKLLAHTFTDDADSLRRFKREAASTTELSHENIVSIFDVGEDDNPYIVMEYIGGEDLKSYIKTNNPIPNSVVVNIMDQVLDAISYAHHHGTIHRDIKPQNILMDTDGSVKVTDFGIALAISQHSITQTNSLLGSVHYMSPEQAKGGMATHASDIYSLGILLYELLTGEVPFNGETPVSIALKHFQEDLPSIRDKNPDVPQALENIVLKATVKEPSLRYQSVDEMRRDLKTALDPSRLNEAKYVADDINDSKTIMMAPIKEPEHEASTQSHSVALENKSQESKKKSRKGLIFSLIMIPLLIIAGLFYYVMSSAPEEVEIPDLENFSLAEANRQLEDLNLEVGEVIEETNDDIEAGYVIRTNPAGGSTIRENQSVDLFISSGEELFTVEDYTGENFEEIRAKLTEIGFTVESTDVSDNNIETGHIVSQDTSPDTEVVPNDTTIHFEVSTGPAGFNFRDLTGYTRVGVDDYVEEHNLNLTVEYADSDTVEEGQVMSQSPEPGSTIYENSNVTVVFSQGPEEPEIETFSRLVQIEYVPNDQQQEVADEDARLDENETDANEEVEENERPEEPEPNHIQVYISDEENDFEEPYLDFEIYETVTRTLDFTVERGDTASYRIVRDGEIIEEREVSRDRNEGG